VKVPEDAPAYRIGARWFVRCMMDSVIGRLGPDHTVTEHEDGTITVSPSILDERPGCGTYHGWLERGVWRDA
jgi:hypothetical protein